MPRHLAAGRLFDGDDPLRRRLIPLPDGLPRHTDTAGEFGIAADDRDRALQSFAGVHVLDGKQYLTWPSSDTFGDAVKHRLHHPEVSFHERFAQARKRAKLSQQAVASHFRISRAAVSLWEQGETFPDPDKLPELSTLLGVGTEWLWSGRGPEQFDGPRGTPLVGYVGAGEEVIPFDDHAQGSGLQSLPLILGLENAVAVEVRGDSMRPVYRPGDALYYRRDDSVPPDKLIGRECVVRLRDGRMFVKVLRRGTRKGRFSLHSYSAELMEDQDVDWAAPVEFIRRAR